METSPEKLLAAGEPPKLLQAPRKRPGVRKGPVFLIGGGLLLLLAVFFLLGYLPRHKREKAAAEAARKEAAALPVVNVIQVRLAPATANLLLPGNTTPITEAYIYARANGYVRRRYVDIGDHVREGQVMAEIDAPELDQQVVQARAALAQSEQQLQQARSQLENAAATQDLNRVTYDRYRVLGEHGAVSRQDVDQQLANFRTAVANVHLQEAAVRTNEENVRASRANLDRIIALQSFEQVRAPFTGVVTARNFDIGALISSNGTSLGAASPTTPSGGSQASGATGNEGTTGSPITATQPTQGTGGGIGELFRLAQIGTLRILIDVPQDNAPTIRAGQRATVFVQQFPGRRFEGKVTRTSESLDPAARTLLTEVQVANRDGVLLPGMYSQVQFADRRAYPPLLVPGDSLIITPAGMQVAVMVDPSQQQMEQWRQQQQQQREHEKDSDKDQKTNSPPKQEPPPKRIHMQTVQVGRDYGPQTEITSGLAGWEYVATNPGDFAEEGTLVTPMGAPPTAGQGNPQRQGRSEQEPGGIGSPSMQAPTQGKQGGKSSSGGNGKGGGK